MSDYIPDPRRVDPTDPYRNTARYEYTEDTTGRSSYAVVALLGIVALVGGVLMFTGPKQPADQQAQVPPPISMTTPLEQPAPARTPAAPTPATPATPQQ